MNNLSAGAGSQLAIASEPRASKSRSAADACGGDAGIVAGSTVMLDSGAGVVRETMCAPLSVSDMESGAVTTPPPASPATPAATDSQQCEEAGSFCFVGALRHLSGTPDEVVGFSSPCCSGQCVGSAGSVEGEGEDSAHADRCVPTDGANSASAANTVASTVYSATTTHVSTSGASDDDSELELDTWTTVVITCVGLAALVLVGFVAWSMCKEQKKGSEEKEQSARLLIEVKPVKPASAAQSSVRAARATRAAPGLYLSLGSIAELQQE